MSQTPITDAHEFYEAGNYEVVWPEEMRKIELAANGLRDHLKAAPIYRLSETTHEFMMRYKEWYRAKHELITAFAALQPSPYDAPRTESHE